MKLIPVRDAVGHVLCHDMTQIIPGQYKDARFRKGHVVREEDVPVLLRMGKEHLYVWEMIPGMVHEDAAAARLCALCQGEHMDPGPVKEGKIQLTAAIDGLFRVDARLVSDHYSGEDFCEGSKLCFRLTYKTPEKKKIYVYFIYEERLILASLSEMLGRQIQYADKTVLYTVKVL